MGRRKGRERETSALPMQIGRTKERKSPFLLGRGVKSQSCRLFLACLVTGEFSTPSKFRAPRREKGREQMRKEEAGGAGAVKQKGPKGSHKFLLSQAVATRTDSRGVGEVLLGSKRGTGLA